MKTAAAFVVSFFFATSFFAKLLVSRIRTDWEKHERKKELRLFIKIMIKTVGGNHKEEKCSHIYSC